MARKKLKIRQNTPKGSNEELKDAADPRHIVQGIRPIAIGLSRLRDCAAITTKAKQEFNEGRLSTFDHNGPLAVCPHCNRVIFMQFETKCQLLFSILVHWVERCEFLEGAFEFPNLAQIFEIINDDDFWFKFIICCPHCGIDGVEIILNSEYLGLEKAYNVTN